MFSQKPHCIRDPARAASKRLDTATLRKAVSKMHGQCEELTETDP